MVSSQTTVVRDCPWCDQTTVVRDCPWCDKTQSVTVESEAWNVYQLGALVQEAFPYLNRSQRRILVSGICDSCWERMSTF